MVFMVKSINKYDLKYVTRVVVLDVIVIEKLNQINYLTPQK